MCVIDNALSGLDVHNVECSRGWMGQRRNPGPALLWGTGQQSGKMDPPAEE